MVLSIGIIFAKNANFLQKKMLASAKLRVLKSIFSKKPYLCALK